MLQPSSVAPVAIPSHPTPAALGTPAPGDVQQNNDQPNTTIKNGPPADEGEPATEPQQVSGSFLTDGTESTAAETKSMSFNDIIQGTSAPADHG